MSIWLIAFLASCALIVGQAVLSRYAPLRLLGLAVVPWGPARNVQVHRDRRDALRRKEHAPDYRRPALAPVVATRLKLVRGTQRLGATSLEALPGRPAALLTSRAGQLALVEHLVVVEAGLDEQSGVARVCARLVLPVGETVFAGLLVLALIFKNAGLTWFTGACIAAGVYGGFVSFVRIGREVTWAHEEIERHLSSARKRPAASKAGDPGRA